MPMKQLHMVGVVAVIGVVLLIVGILYSWGYFEKSSETFRYKLTITAQVDGRLHSAASVIEATQKRANCPWWGFSGSGAGGGCLPRFKVKGVAPMIRLPDGSVIFASLSGYSSDQPPGVEGRSLGRLPWLLYVPNWRKATDTTQRNWSIIPQPEKTPRLEIPFEGHPLSKFKPAMHWVPDQQIGPPLGHMIGPGYEQQYTKRNIELIGFSIENTSNPVVEWLDPAPPWMAAYRGGPRISEEERKKRIRRVVQGLDTRGPPARSNIESSKRMF